MYPEIAGPVVDYETLPFEEKRLLKHALRSGRISTSSTSYSNLIRVPAASILLSEADTSFGSHGSPYYPVDEKAEPLVCL